MGDTILDQLKKEHKEVKSLLSEAEDCSENQRSDILSEIKSHLVPHARGEEKTIYALLKERLEDNNSSDEDMTLVNEAYEEHRVADTLLEDLEGMKTDNEKWTAHLKVLKENIEHHIKEEEDELFDRIKNHFSKSELEELKGVYLNAKEHYEDDMPPQSKIRERQATSEARSI